MQTAQGSQGALIAGAGGALLIIFMFLPWFGIDATDESFNAWEFLTIGDIFLLITGLVAIGAAVGAGGALLPGLSLSGAATMLGGISTVLLLWLLIFDWPDGAGREIWVFLALIAAAAITFGGYTAGEEESREPREPREPRGAAPGPGDPV